MAGQHVFRECEGVVLKLEKAYYLLGVNFVVPANKKREHSKYMKLRNGSRLKPNGMGLLAIEYDDISGNPGLYPSVTMTLAASHQPVLARTALLHLGTRSTFKVAISDTDVEPSELRPSKLAADIHSTIERLSAKGCTEFGARIRASLLKGQWTRQSSRVIAESILSIIDNSPAWEQKKKPKANARGAIETAGPPGKRPRD